MSASLSLPVPQFLFCSVIFFIWEIVFLLIFIFIPNIQYLPPVFQGVRDARLILMDSENVEGHWRELTAVLECSLLGREGEHVDASLQLPLHPGHLWVPKGCLPPMKSCLKWGCQLIPWAVKWHVQLEPLRERCERPAKWEELWKCNNLKVPFTNKLGYSPPLAAPQNWNGIYSHIIHCIAVWPWLLSFFPLLFHLFP